MVLLMFVSAVLGSVTAASPVFARMPATIASILAIEFIGLLYLLIGVDAKSPDECWRTPKPKTTPADAQLDAPCGDVLE